MLDRKRPPRLERLFEAYDPPIYFVTFNTASRKPVLANTAVHACFLGFCGHPRHDILVGRYVIMPDHIHLFVSGRFDLSQWVRHLKRVLSVAIPAERPHWQRGFFDHVLRSSESYAEKWEYVRRNPERAGSVAAWNEWPFGGEVSELRFH